jgi:hypothetical protein
MPVICVGTTTDLEPVHARKYCIIELEDRYKAKCSPETTFLTVRYFESRAGEISETGGDEFCSRPRTYQRFVNATLDTVQKGYSSARSVLRFVDFSSFIAEQTLRPLERDQNLAYIECSRWGTRIFGNTNGRPEQLDIHTYGDDYKSSVKVTLSCRGAEGLAEIRLDCRGLVKKRAQFEKVSLKEANISITLNRLDPETVIEILFRSNTFADIVLHYLLIEALVL